jgi:hypothetical protein
VCNCWQTVCVYICSAFSLNETSLTDLIHHSDQFNNDGILAGDKRYNSLCYICRSLSRTAEPSTPSACLRMAINPLTTELNPSAQRCLTTFFAGILLLEPCISLIRVYARKTNKCNNYSFSLLIMYGNPHMFRHYIAILRERSKCLLRDAQLRSS